MTWNSVNALANHFRRTFGGLKSKGILVIKHWDPNTFNGIIILDPTTQIVITLTRLNIEVFLVLNAGWV